MCPAFQAMTLFDKRLSADETAARDSVRLDSAAGIFPEWMACCRVWEDSPRLSAWRISELNVGLSK